MRGNKTCSICVNITMYAKHNTGWMNSIWPFVVLLVLTFVAASCTKREFNLSEDTTLTGTLDPVFAVPLVHGTWSFGEVMDAIEIPAALETDASGVITAVFPFDAFETAPIPLVPLSESAEVSLNLDAEQAAVLSLLPAGAEFNANFSNVLELPMPDLVEVDSVWLGGGALVVHIESDLPLVITASGTCDNLLVDGQPLVVELSLEPVAGVSEVLIPMSDATLVGSGNDGVSLGWEWSVVLASTIGGCSSQPILRPCMQGRSIGWDEQPPMVEAKTTLHSQPKLTPSLPEPTRVASDMGINTSETPATGSRLNSTTRGCPSTNRLSHVPDAVITRGKSDSM